MDLGVPPELEELMLCSCCHLPFDDIDAVPKLFSCRHFFCLKCVNSILQKQSELCCMHCWKRTEIPGPDMNPENLPTYGAILYLTQNYNLLNINKLKSSSGKQRSLSSTSANLNNSGNICVGNVINESSNLTISKNKNFKHCSEPTLAQMNINKTKNDENCITHGMPNTLWCALCNMLICRACAASEKHSNHVVKSHVEAKKTIQTNISDELSSMQKLLNDMQHLVLRQRDFLLKILESCTALKTQIEIELMNHLPTLEIAEIRESLCKAKTHLDMLRKEYPADALRFFTTLQLEKHRLISRHQEMFLQCKLDDLIRNCGMVFDFSLIKQALVQLHSCVISGDNWESFGFINGATFHHNPVLLLANYCISQLYSRNVLALKPQKLLRSGRSSFYFQLHPHHSQLQCAVTRPDYISSQSLPHDITTNSQKSNQNHHHPNNSTSNNGFRSHHAQGLVTLAPRSGVRLALPSQGTYASTMQHMQQKQHCNQVQKSIEQQKKKSAAASLLCNPSLHVYPIYYFNIEINSQTVGRILIEVRNDVAPKMANNFGALTTHELGFGYKGCQIFQCWENESIITGDFELNNGRGGRSVFEEYFFMPDDTKIIAVRGSVGMRRSQKRHNSMGLVGSQFRVILREMRGFTAIFAYVVEGLELVEKISQKGDAAGKPQSNVVVQNCGIYQ